MIKTTEQGWAGCSYYEQYNTPERMRRLEIETIEDEARHSVYDCLAVQSFKVVHPSPAGREIKEDGMVYTDLNIDFCEDRHEYWGIILDDCFASYGLPTGTWLLIKKNATPVNGSVIVLKDGINFFDLYKYQKVSEYHILTKYSNTEDVQILSDAEFTSLEPMGILISVTIPFAH